MITRKIKFIKEKIANEPRPVIVEKNASTNWLNFNNIFATVVVLMSFLLPWIFTSYTFEYYETAKNTFLLISLLVLISLVAVKVIRRKKVQLMRTPFDVLFIILLAVQVLSLIFSINKETSIWGYNSRFTGGLISFLGLLALYYLLVNNTNEKISKFTLKSLTLSISLLALYTILKSFNSFNGLFEELSKVHPSLAFLKSPLFTPAGNPNSLVYIFILILPLSLKYIFSDHLKYKIFGAVSSSLLLLGVSITTAANGIDIYNLTIWALVVTVVVLSTVYHAKALGKANAVFYLLPVIVFVIIGFIFSIDSSLRSNFQLNFSRYYEIPFNTSWSVITGTYKEYKIGGFLVGTGPDTYAFNFPRFRPVEQNLEPNWFENYTRSSSQVEGILVNTGILGLIAMLIFGGAVLYFLFRNVFKKETTKNSTNFTLGLVIVLYFLTSFLLYMPIILHVIFWIALAVLTRNYLIANPDKKDHFELKLQVASVNKKGSRNLAPAIFGASLLVFAAIWLFVLVRNYQAEVYYKKSLIAASFEDLANANDYVLQAIQLNNNRDYYHRQLSTVGLLYTKKLTQTQVDQGSEEEKTLNQQLNYFLSLTTQELNRAIALNPSNFENLQLATVIYKQLIDLSQGKAFGNQALQAVSEAIKLNPTNPDNYLLLGFLYQFNENQETAKQAEQYYIRAYNLQPSYPISIFTLGNYLEGLQKYQDALIVYKNSLELFYQQEGTQVNTLLKQKIDEVQKKIDAASSEEGSTEGVSVTPTVTQKDSNNNNQED